MQQKNGVRDLRDERVKVVLVDARWLARHLANKGQQLMKVEGWPEETVELRNVALTTVPEPNGGTAPLFILTLHHPSWPISLAAQPPVLPINVQMLGADWWGSEMKAALESIASGELSLDEAMERARGVLSGMRPQTKPGEEE